MKYFLECFYKRIYILPGILLLLWIALKFISIFDITLWVQGHTRISIGSILFIMFVICLLITYTIDQTREQYNEHIIVMPALLVVYLIVFSMTLYMNPKTIDYFEKDNYSVIVENTSDSSNGILYFYKKEGIFAKRFAYCKYHESINNDCIYDIVNGNLVLMSKNTTGTEIFEEFSLD